MQDDIPTLMEEAASIFPGKCHRDLGARVSSVGKEKAGGPSSPSGYFTWMPSLIIYVGLLVDRCKMGHFGAPGRAAGYSQADACRHRGLHVPKSGPAGTAAVRYLSWSQALIEPVRMQSVGRLLMCNSP